MKKLIILFTLLPIILFAQGKERVGKLSLWDWASAGNITTLSGANVLPYANGLYNLGASGTAWNLGYMDSLYLNNIQLGTNGVASGVFNFIMSDNDLFNISGTTSDQMTFNGASGGYLFDDDLLFSAAETYIMKTTSDGADNGATYVSGGGAISSTRGGYIQISGNEHASTGLVSIVAGNTGGNSTISFHTGAGVEKWRIGSTGIFQSADPGTNANSYSISLIADKATTPQTGIIDIKYGAEPYFNIAPPNGAGTATDAVFIKSQQMSFIDTYALTTNTADDDYVLLKAVDNDDNVLYEVARLTGAATPTFDILAGKLTGALSGNSQNITGVGQLAATTYGSDGTVSDAELLYINSLSSNAQTQINAKVSSSSFITASRVYDCGSVAAGVDSVFSITATGAVAGNPVQVGVTVAAEQQLIITAECTTNDVVSVRISNHGLVSAVDPVSRTYKVIVTNL